MIMGLLFGAGFGFLIGTTAGRPALSPETPPGPSHDHSAHDHGKGEHDHSAITEVEGPPPDLTLAVHPDGEQSRNLHIDVTNFTFDPQGVNSVHVPGQGHAHVYINGVKQARAYGPWVHLHALPQGRHDIRVTLNANDHSQLAASGQPIEATTTVVID